MRRRSINKKKKDNTALFFLLKYNSCKVICFLVDFLADWIRKGKYFLVDLQLFFSFCPYSVLDDLVPNVKLYITTSECWFCAP